MTCPICDDKKTLPLVDLWTMFNSDKMLTDYKPKDIPTLDAPCCYCSNDELRKFVEEHGKQQNAPNIFIGTRVYQHPDLGSYLMLPIAGDNPFVAILLGGQ